MHSSTLIDHFITNEPDKISKFGVIHTGISDHSLIYGIRKTNICHKDNGNILEIRNMKKFNEEKFLCDLGMQSWDYVYFFADNPNTMWEIWKDLFLQILDKHAPLQSKKIKSKSSPWITSHLKHLIITRDNLKRKAVITKLDTDWEKYKKARNETNTKLRQAKRDYFSIKISAEKQNPKAAWKTINTLLGRHYQPSKVNELNINDMKFTKPKDIAEGFNTFFSNIGPNLAEEIDTAESNFKDYLDKTISEFTAFQSVTVNHVCHLLCELPGSKATGLDKISSKLIKLAAPIISDSLTYIFNQSITLCTFPHEWKIARVIPLFKNGKRSLPGNYRPISVLPAISKVMERILYNQLYEYLTANNVLSEHQFGFRKFHSTASALLDCTNDSSKINKKTLMNENNRNSHRNNGHYNNNGLNQCKSQNVSLQPFISAPVNNREFDRVPLHDTDANIDNVKTKETNQLCDQVGQLKQNIPSSQGSKPNNYQYNQHIPTRITYRKQQLYPRRRSHAKRNDLNNQNDLIRHNDQNNGWKSNDDASRPRERRQLEEGFRTERRWRDKMKFYQFFY